MRGIIAGLIGIGAALVASTAMADGLYRTNTGPGGPDFSGFNIGLDVGAGFGSSGSINTSGLAGGLQAGYNLQNGAIVGGVAADVLFGQISGGVGGVATYRENSLASARVVGGYVVSGIMAFGTLGWSYSSSNYSAGGASADKSINGVVYGLGAEIPLTRSVSARAEFRRYDFGSNTYYLPTSANALSSSANMLLLGVSTHF